MDFFININIAIVEDFFINIAIAIAIAIVIKVGVIEVFINIAFVANIKFMELKLLVVY